MAMAARAGTWRWWSRCMTGHACASGTCGGNPRAGAIPDSAMTASRVDPDMGVGPGMTVPAGEPAASTVVGTEGWCTEALEVLYDMAGRDLMRCYSPDHLAGQSLLQQELTTAAQAELFLSSDLDIDRIAGAMI